jgi:hypothetical protein
VGDGDAIPPPTQRTISNWHHHKFVTIEPIRKQQQK